MNDTDGIDIADVSRQRQRLALAAAAACLIVVLGIVGVLALTGRDGSDAAGMTRGSADGLDLELWVSTTEPSPTETVTAKLTITNRTSEPIELPQVCGIPIVLSTPGPFERLEPPFDTGSADLDQALAAQAGAWFRTGPLRDPRTIEQLDEILEEVGPPPDSCEPGKVVLAPGASTATSRDLVVGTIGLPAGPGVVSATMLRIPAPIEVSVPITVPEPTNDVITRADAITRALADPQVRAVLAQLLPAESSALGVERVYATLNSPPAPSDSPPPPSGPSSALGLEETTQGWSISYVRHEGAFVATVDPSGAVHVASRP